ncbi:DNA polymerase I [Deltaproteobacteria bacterium TL4]
MPILYAVDSMAILYRSYFAMIRNPLINFKGMNTNGIFGFLTQLMGIIEKKRPDYLAVVTDTPEPTFRHELFPKYKATREKMPEDLVEQLPYLPRLVNALGLPYLSLPGYEADDIIGTLMRICREQALEGVMVTSDKDYMQLISDTTTMLNHKQERITRQGVLDKFGCAPEQVIEVLGLMGDTSDNIPGVFGVGEKTAMKLINSYGSIENLYRNLDQLSGEKLKEKLIEGKENALLSRELVTINCQVPIDIDLQQLHLKNTDLYDNPAFHEVLEELEFRTFLKKYSQGGIPQTEPQTKTQDTSSSLSPAIQGNYHLIVEFAELQSFIAQLKDKEVVAFDLDSENAHIVDARIRGVSFCVSPGKACYLSLESFRKQRNEVLTLLQSIFENTSIPKVGANVKQAIQLLHHEGIQLQPVLSDVMLASHLVDPVDKNEHTLNNLIQHKLLRSRQYQLVSSSPQLSMLEDPDTVDDVNIRSLYYCENADAIFQLNTLLSAHLKQAGMWALYSAIEIPLLRSLAFLELEGVLVDLDGLHHISEEFEERLSDLTQEIHGHAGEVFNINSVPELQTILYNKLALHQLVDFHPKKIKIGNQMSTDEETLEKMSQFPMAQAILKYRTLNKLKNTYLDQLPTFVHKKTKRIHTSFQQMVTATGRLSSDNPNLQNIPIRTVEGRRIRKAFVAPPGHVLLAADYSQIELRIVAHYSKDPTFLEAYRHNKDIHALTAAAIFKVPEKEVTREMRAKAKEVNFGLIYKMGPDRLALVTQTTKMEAKAFIERYFERYATIHALQEQFMEQARKEGYALTLMGRRRYLPDINGKGLARRFAEGAAINTPIQGSAAEIIKLAMIAVDQRLQKEKLKAKMVLTVHDELVFETPENEAQYLGQVVQEEMENVVILEVPLTIDFGKGINWLDAH